MAFNGSGTYLRTNGTYAGSTVWAQDNAAGQKIVDTRHDAHDQDIANGLSNCVTRDGQSARTADSPMSGYKHTNVAVGTARTNYAQIGQLQDNGLLYAGVSTGSSNAYAITLTPAITAYAAGQRYMFRANFSNSSACTLAVNGLTAYAIKRMDGSVDLGNSMIISGELVEVVYDTTGAPHFRILNKPVANLTPIADQAYNLGTSALAYASLAVASIIGANATDLTFKKNDSATQWSIGQATGELKQDGTNGSNIVMNKVGTGLRLGVSATVGAAGTNLATATQMTNLLNVVTTSTNPTALGVILPPSSGVGLLTFLSNNSANTITVYAATGETIDGAASTTLASTVGRGWAKMTSTNWVTIARA